MTKRRSDASAQRGRSKVARSAATGRFVKTESAAASTDKRTRVARTASSTARERGSRRLRLVAESERLDRLIEHLGNNRLARLMAVSPSQPSRWRAGKEGIGPENQRRLMDLDYVFGRLEQLFTPRQADIWLTSLNAHLGARPIDVLRLRGVTPVISAIDAEAEGAFA